MKVTQIASLLNATIPEVLGKEAVVNEDLSNVVDLGKDVIDTDNVDNYVKKLVNHIGKVIFTDRLYNGNVPSVLMDSWEFGSVLEKVTADLPDAQESDTWKLENGKEYSQDVFYQPQVSAKFFNSKTTFEIPLSFTDTQVKESFSDVTQLNGFLSMLQTSVANAMTIRIDNLIMKTINNMTAETLVSELGATPDSTKTGVKAVNLLTLYTQSTGKTVTAEKAMTDPDFIKFASYQIGIYQDRISKISTLFNVGGKERFTPIENNHLVLLSDFAKATDVFVAGDTYHDEKVSLPNNETVPFWQGSGNKYDFADTSSIDVKTSSGKTVKFGGIIGVMFDTNAVGVSNLDQRVTSNYNAKAEFYTNYYKLDAGYYNDLNENFVVFFVGNPTATAPAQG